MRANSFVSLLLLPLSLSLSIAHAGENQHSLYKRLGEKKPSWLWLMTSSEMSPQTNASIVFLPKPTFLI